MVKAKTKVKSKKHVQKRTDDDPYDGVFAIKLALYVVAGSMWLKISSGHSIIPIPVGLIAGMYLASKEHFRTDRKIDYAVLLIAALFGFWAPFGLYVSL